MPDRNNPKPDAICVCGGFVFSCFNGFLLLWLLIARQNPPTRPPPAQPVLELHRKWRRSGETEGSLTVRTEFDQSNIFLKNKQTKSHTSSLQPQQIFRLIICWNCGFVLAVEHLMRLRKSAEKAENRCVGFKPPLMAFQCTLWQIGDAVYPILYSALISFMTAHRAAAVQKRFSCTDVYFCPSICAHPSGALPPLKFIMW